jgi:hypothetical protein
MVAASSLTGVSNQTEIDLYLHSNGNSIWIYWVTANEAGTAAFVKK